MDFLQILWHFKGDMNQIMKCNKKGSGSPAASLLPSALLAVLVGLVAMKTVITSSN